MTVEINSSRIKHIDYDQQTQEMIVTFPNGSRYKYLEVKPKTVLDIVNSPSAGTTFQEKIIKANVKYEKLP